MTDHIGIDSLFESYNNAIADKFMQSMQNVRNPEDYKKLMDEARNEWESKIMGTKTPSELFSEIPKEDLPEVFIKASKTCDELVPMSLADTMINRCNHQIIADLAKNAPDIDVKTSAISLLGMTENAEYTDTLIDLLYDEGEYSDLIAEKAREAIVNLGPNTIDYIEKKISLIKKVEGADFHLLIALIGIDSERKSDRIFTMLKDGFRNTSDKALAARCLADYKDGRAVTLLRGFLARSSNTVDEETVREIQGAVLNLGGSLEGLN